MSITSNRICGVCGKKIGMLDAVYSLPALRDNCYICDDCVNKCSDFIDYQILNTWTSADVRKHMTWVNKEMPGLIAKEFHETDAVCSRQDKGEKIMLVDSRHGWLYAPGCPELIELRQIASWSLTPFTSSEDVGMHLTKYKAPRPDMEVPGRMEVMTGLTLVIELKDHPYANHIDVPIIGEKHFMQNYKKYMDLAYAMAEECYELLEKYAKNAVGEITFE